MTAFILQNFQTICVIFESGRILSWNALTLISNGHYFPPTSCFPAKVVAATSNSGYVWIVLENLSIYVLTVTTLEGSDGFGSIVFEDLFDVRFRSEDFQIEISSRFTVAVSNDNVLFISVGSNILFVCDDGAIGIVGGLNWKKSVILGKAQEYEISSLISIESENPWSLWCGDNGGNIHIWTNHSPFRCKSIFKCRPAEASDVLLATIPKRVIAVWKSEESSSIRIWNSETLDYLLVVTHDLKNVISISTLPFGFLCLSDKSGLISFWKGSVPKGAVSEIASQSEASVDPVGTSRQSLNDFRNQMSAKSEKECRCVAASLFATLTHFHDLICISLTP